MLVTTLLCALLSATIANAEENLHRDQDCPNLSGIYESDGVRSEVRQERDAAGNLQLQIQEKSNYVFAVNGKAAQVDGRSAKVYCKGKKTHVVWYQPDGAKGRMAYSLDGKNNLVAELFDDKDVALKVIAIRVK